jgi:hypothetical protein
MDRGCGRKRHERCISGNGSNALSGSRGQGSILLLSQVPRCVLVFFSPLNEPISYVVLYLFLLLVILSAISCAKSFF